LKRERIRDPNDGIDYFKHELRPHCVKGVEAVLIFRFLSVTEIFIEAHKTSRDGSEDCRSSESVSLTLGWILPTQIHRKTRISSKPCRQIMQDYKQMA